MSERWSRMGPRSVAKFEAAVARVREEMRLLDSSVVERSADYRDAGGSNPPPATNLPKSAWMPESSLFATLGLCSTHHSDARAE